MCGKERLNETESDRLHQLIEDKTIDINSKRDKNNPPLVLLCQRHRSQSLCSLLDAILKREDLIVDSCSPNGFNALMFICRFYRRSNLIDCVKLLVSRGIRLDAREKGGRTALEFVCLNYKGSDLVDIVILLICRDNIDRCMNILKQRNLRSEFEVMQRILHHTGPGRGTVIISFISYFAD